VAVIESVFAADVAGKDPAAALAAALTVNVPDEPTLMLSGEGDTVMPEGIPDTMTDAVLFALPVREMVTAFDDPGVSVIASADIVRLSSTGGGSAATSLDRTPQPDKITNAKSKT